MVRSVERRSRRHESNKKPRPGTDGAATQLKCKPGDDGRSCARKTSMQSCFSSSSRYLLRSLRNLSASKKADGLFLLSMSALNLGRFLRTGFLKTRQNRPKRQETGPVTGYPAEQGLAWAPCTV